MDNQTTENLEMTDEQRSEAFQRAQTCGQEIRKILEQHRCRIVPYISNMEHVGREGTKALVEASYGIIPEVGD